MKQNILITQQLECITKSQLANALHKLFNLSGDEVKQINSALSEKEMNPTLSELCDSLKLAGLDTLASKLNIQNVSATFKNSTPLFQVAKN